MSEKELRKEMIKGVIEEIRGPRFGVNEVIKYDPWSEYLIGNIIPKKWKAKEKNNITFDDLDFNNTSESDYASSDDSNLDEGKILGNSSPILNPNSQIRSFGISFFVNSQKSVELDICITWARYFNVEDVTEGYDLDGSLTEKGKDETLWKRKSFGKIIKFNTGDCQKGGNLIKIYDSDDGVVELFIKRQDFTENKSHMSVYVINNLNVTENKSNYHPYTSDCIFQPSIRINMDDLGDIIEMDTLMDPDDELNFLYRNKPVIATGHLCSVIWENNDYYDEFSNYEHLLWPDESFDEEYQKFKKPSIRSEFLPLCPINLPDFDVGKGDLELHANWLAYATQDEIYQNLIKLYDSYLKWIENNEHQFDLIPDDYKSIGKGILKRERESLDRIKEGIELIKSEKLVYLAFCFANKTIHLQDEWKRGINVTKGSEINSNYDGNSFKWRPFQLAFILISLESIWNENSKNKDTLDLLWIPTGGGKTEAYLGIMAFTMALRRLKSRYGLIDEKTGAGVSIISRYTLRLLTVQQFRRTLRMVTAAEYLRVHESYGKVGWRNSDDISEDWIYGTVRFSVGMWVGGSVTPLHLNKENGAIDILKSSEKTDGYGNPAQIMKCPVCGAWLAVPEDDGLSDLENHVHVVINTKETINSVEKKINIINEEDYIDKFNVTSMANKNDFLTISIYFNRPINTNEYSSIVKFIYDNYEMVSLNKLTPGYIKSQGKLGRKERDVTDYEIWCTNPECILNHKWEEGVPFSDDKTEFFDGNHRRIIESPFKSNVKIPIPAYLIDEHVYYRCPTVIISTADKIARLAYEPRAGSLFGIVNKFNKHYGYYRNELLPDNYSKDVIGEKFYKHVKPFSPPDLIIQDELHLLNGPLGSLFGLYENMVNAIMKKQGGNPKYIASTATINNAEKQVKLLFAKEVSQFPPYGFDISDSFFVKDFERTSNNQFNCEWDENNKGRIYMGIYSPGLGHFTHQIRLYSRLLKIANENIDEKNINYYWTLVGYYNALKELGSGVALYQDDIYSRLKIISPEDNLRLIKPQDDSIELSSRINSIDLPIILDKLERDGNNNPPDFNAIFTTSMFGTGVDISHLSTMIMNAQPKTTGDYIQATGRIGRNHGGLIIDLFRSGRPRDLNHYELFTSYHSRINREVEPISVSPFSEGCLSRGLGPTLVSYLRNVGQNYDNLDVNPRNILLDYADDYIAEFKNMTLERLNKMCMPENEINNIFTKIDKDVEFWKKIAEEKDEIEFAYDEKYSKYRKPKKSVVLGDSAHEKINGLEIIYKNAPISLRDIEDTLEFWV